MNEFRKKVIEFRKRNGITQKQLADRCGVTRATIWLIENEPHHNVNMITRGKLEKVINDQ